jgi:2-oxo-hept-3-ene-1,7-dioate hydratase
MQTLTEQIIQQEAARLDLAEKQRQQVDASTVSHPDMTIHDAYLIQDAWVNTKIKGGKKVIGHKVGLTSRVMQQVMSINEPDFGVLLDDMYFEDGSEIEAGLFLDPRIEVEVAFILSEDIDPKVSTVEEVLAATEKIVPALELIAARSYRVNPNTGYKRTVRDTISDNAANAGIILGDVSIPKDAMLCWVPCMMYKNSIIEQSGVSGAILGHPAKSVIWLANKYAEFNRQLKKGDIVLAGSFTAPIIVKAGDKVVADFNQYGKVTCSFI